MGAAGGSTAFQKVIHCKERSWAIKRETGIPRSVRQKQWRSLMEWLICLNIGYFILCKIVKFTWGIRVELRPRTHGNPMPFWRNSLRLGGVPYVSGMALDYYSESGESHPDSAFICLSEIFPRYLLPWQLIKDCLLSLNTDHKVPISNPDSVQASDIYIILLMSKTSSDTAFKKGAFPVCVHPTCTQPFSILNVLLGTVSLNLVTLN